MEVLVRMSQENSRFFLSPSGGHFPSNFIGTAIVTDRKLAEDLASMNDVMNKRRNKEFTCDRRQFISAAALTFAAAGFGAAGTAVAENSDKNAPDITNLRPSSN